MKSWASLIKKTRQVFGGLPNPRRGKNTSYSMEDFGTSAFSLFEVLPGDPTDAAELMPLLYEELRKLAAQKLAGEPAGQTLQPTALVHEAWLRMTTGQVQKWQNPNLADAWLPVLVLLRVCVAVFEDVNGSLARS